MKLNPTGHLTSCKACSVPGMICLRSKSLGNWLASKKSQMTVITMDQILVVEKEMTLAPSQMRREKKGTSNIRMVIRRRKRVNHWLKKSRKVT